jgi:PTS system fructose-specific IIC component
MAAEALRKAALQDGMEIEIEIHSYAGKEGNITDQQIAEADGIVWASDIAFPGRERYDESRVVQIRPKDAIKDPKGAIARAIELGKGA